MKAICWPNRNSINRSPSRWRLLIPLVLGCFSLASAATITVTNTNDNGIGSLRQAISDSSPGDTIDFDSSLNGLTITLTTGELLIDKDLSIIGPGANLLAVNGNDTSILFSVNWGIEASISGLTITHGNGGGIWNNGSLTITNSTLTLNAGALYGGGISNFGSLAITNSTLSYNSANNGGGIGNFGGGLVTVTNSTLSGNLGFSGGAIFNSGSLAIANCTLSNNVSPDNDGGGILNELGLVEIGNTILNAGLLGANIVSAEAGTVTSLGYNISSDDGGGFLGGPGDH